MSGITLTYNAIEHFKELLRSEDEPLDIRMVVDKPGTMDADLGITFCPYGENEEYDEVVEYQEFKIFIEQRSATYLQNAIIDFVLSELGGELTVKAPLIRGELPDPNATLAQRVAFVLDKYINPNLAHHGGNVSLFEITSDNTVKLIFGGGCQGCSMSQVTLKNSVEKTLLHYCKDIMKIEDATSHEKGDNPYC
jgi:Fe/S biogenesis protein NfuA